MRFMQTESVLQTKNRSRPAKNQFSVALGIILSKQRTTEVLHLWCLHMTETGFLTMQLI